MASAYGSWVGGDDWRAYVEITLKANSETATQATYIVKAWLQSGAGGYASNLPIKGWAGIWGTKENGTAGYTWSTAFDVGTFGANEWKYSSSTPFNRTAASQEFVVYKTHSQQTVYGYSDIIGESGALAYAGKESKAVATLTLAAKTSYQVTYNVNGGTGTIAAQTKWHDEDLTLTTDTPTRTNYRFLGWATSSTATTPTYQPGATFTANTATPLYAVWERTLIAPTISALNVYRVASSAPTVYNDDGTNVYVSCTWAVDTTLVSGNKGQTLSIDYRTVGASTWTAANSTTLSTTSATTSVNVKSTASGNPNVTFAVGTSYDVRVTVTDTQGSSTSAMSTISTSYVPFDLASSTQGHTMAFGRSASDSIPSGKQGEIAFSDSLWPVFDQPSDWREQLGVDSDGIKSLFGGAITTGSFSWTTTSSDYLKSQSISFGITYASAPIVMLTLGHNWTTNSSANALAANGITAVVADRTTTGATVKIWNKEVNAGNAITVYWMAFGPV